MVTVFATYQLGLVLTVHVKVTKTVHGHVFRGNTKTLINHKYEVLKLGMGDSMNFKVVIEGTGKLTGQTFVQRFVKATASSIICESLTMPNSRRSRYSRRDGEKIPKKPDSWRIAVASMLHILETVHKNA